MNALANKINIHTITFSLLIIVFFIVFSCKTTTKSESDLSNTETPDPEIFFTIDVDGCSMSGPFELPVGKHSILFKEIAGEDYELYVARLDDGHTYQELLDLQPSPGVHYTKPAWLRIKNETEVKANNDGHMAWTYYFVTGEYAIYTFSYATWGLWFPEYGVTIVE